MTPTNVSTAGPVQPVDFEPPMRSKVAGALAALACAACCAIPFLLAAGVLTTAGAAIMQRTLLAVAAGLVVAGLGMWWLHHRGARGPSARPASTDDALNTPSI